MKWSKNEDTGSSLGLQPSDFWAQRPVMSCPVLSGVWLVTDERRGESEKSKSSLCNAVLYEQQVLVSYRRSNRDEMGTWA